MHEFFCSVVEIERLSGQGQKLISKESEPSFQPGGTTRLWVALIKVLEYWSIGAMEKAFPGI